MVNLPRKRLAVGAATVVWALVHPDLEGQGARFLEFLDDGTLRWDGLPGFALEEAGTCAVDVVEAAPDVLLVTTMLPPSGRETMVIALDLASHHVLFVASHLDDDNRPFARKTRVSQRFTSGLLYGSPALSLAPPAPTRDLIGTRAVYRYSEDTVYEHIYLNTRWYSYSA